MKPRDFQMREQRKQRVPEAVEIEHQHRLSVLAELEPGELLDQLLERADAAGQRDERVGALEHLAFALVHVARDHHIPRAFERVLARHQKIGDHPGDLTAGIHRRVRDRAHQPDPAAAIDQPDLLAREDLPKLARGRDIDGIVARRRPAIDADAANFGHAAHVAPRAGSVKDAQPT